ncbi:MAG: methyltransferase domain-containing protein [Magnetococcales bacterium]|nr:methyltransferase domain-containing protein [Magnetococcales bacterium]
MSQKEEENTDKGYVYDQAFMQWANANQQSAQVIVPLVLSFWPAKSVVDFGCAMGDWLAVWAKHGLSITGVDGDYVDRDKLNIKKEYFIEGDLNKSQNLGTRFDLVQCLEVAEHIQPENAEKLIDTLTSHSDAILFSASPPGQGGENHINERPYEYWRDLFAKHDYQLFDCIRHDIIEQTKIKTWYRYNTMFYVHKSQVYRLPPEVLKYKIASSGPVPDLAPKYYKLRRMIVRCFPLILFNFLSRLIARIVKS